MRRCRRAHGDPRPARPDVAVVDIPVLAFLDARWLTIRAGRIVTGSWLEARAAAFTRHPDLAYVHDQLRSLHPSSRQAANLVTR